MTKELPTHQSAPEKKHPLRTGLSFVGGFALAVTGYLAGDQLMSVGAEEDTPPTCETSPIDLTIDGQSIITIGEQARHNMTSRRNQILIGAAGLLEDAGLIDIDCEPESAQPEFPEEWSDLAE